ncbi:MAG TPA: hypothetical protein VNS63_10105 [Blastocatellia bacterium]|nr:hypothetical protein [Blastocatellia bacterium]
MDGAYSEAGGAFGMTTWESMNSKAIVQESESTYSSTEEARKHFQDLLKEPGTIIESSASQGSAGDERIVKVFGSFDTEGGAAKIMKRRANKIELIDAGSLTYALAFERAWLKLQF